MLVPYYRQSADYTCGPACLRMVFEYLGKLITEEELTALLETDAKSGTVTDTMSRVVGAQGFPFFEKKESSVSDIKNFLSKDILVIVDFIEPSEEDRHFAVVVGVDESGIILNDPWNGEGFRISLDEFEERWGSPKNRYPKWMMVVLEKDENAP